MSGMPMQCMMMVSSVLRDLGYAVPSDADLSDLVQKAVAKVKADQGLDDKSFDLRLAAIKRI